MVDTGARRALYTHIGENEPANATFSSGTLNSTDTGLTGTASAASQSFVTTTGWATSTSVTTNGTAQTRTANAQNEITGVSGATTPTYDNNGNMTGDETGRQFVYDAWSRLVAVKNSGGTTLETFSYDGLGAAGDGDGERDDDGPVLLEPGSGAGGDGERGRNGAVCVVACVRQRDGAAGQRDRHLGHAEPAPLGTAGSPTGT